MRLPFFGSKKEQKKETAPSAPAAGSPLFAAPDMATFDPFSITPLAPANPAPSVTETSPFDAEPLLPLDPWQEASDAATIAAGAPEARTAESLARAEAIAAAEAARLRAESEQQAAARARELAARETADAEALRLQAAREAAESAAAAAASIAANEQAATARIAAAEAEMEQRIAARIAAAEAQVAALSNAARIPYAVPTARAAATIDPQVIDDMRAAATIDPQVIAQAQSAASADLSATPIGLSERCIACGIDHAAASAIAAERQARERLFVAEQAIEAAERDLADARSAHAAALKAAISETEALLAPARSAAKRKRAA
jgi:hypothetical protein